MKKLVLLGGGQAHARALLEAANLGFSDDLEIDLVSKTPFASAGGLFSSVVSGRLEPEETRIDLGRLCARANVRLRIDEAVEVDLVGHRVRLKSGASLEFDLLSINTGTEPDLSLLQAAEDNGHAIAPEFEFHADFDKFLDRGDGSGEAHIVQIGGGVRGSEMALALAQRYRARWPRSDLKLTLIESESRLVPRQPSRVARILEASLKKFRARIMLESRAREVRREAVLLDNGIAVRSDFTSIATTPRPQQWIQDLPLEHEERGYLTIDRCFRTSNGNVFAAGSVARFRAEPQLAIHSLHQGSTLAANWLAAARGLPLRAYRPPALCVSVVSDGEGWALAVLGSLVLPLSRAIYRWKLWRHRRILRKFRE